jgi:DNA-binding PucR family transcriptional regulator
MEQQEDPAGNALLNQLLLETRRVWDRAAPNIGPALRARIVAAPAVTRHAIVSFRPATIALAVDLAPDENVPLLAFHQESLDEALVRASASVLAAGLDRYHHGRFAAALVEDDQARFEIAVDIDDQSARCILRSVDGDPDRVSQLFELRIPAITQ